MDAVLTSYSCTLAVLFFNADMQRARDGIANILNAEWPCGHLGFVNDTAHLGYSHFSGSVCNT